MPGFSLVAHCLSQRSEDCGGEAGFGRTQGNPDIVGTLRHVPATFVPSVHPVFHTGNPAHTSQPPVAHCLSQRKRRLRWVAATPGPAARRAIPILSGPCATKRLYLMTRRPSEMASHIEMASLDLNVGGRLRRALRRFCDHTPPRSNQPASSRRLRKKAGTNVDRQKDPRSCWPAWFNAWKTAPLRVRLRERFVRLNAGNAFSA